MTTAPTVPPPQTAMSWPDVEALDATGVMLARPRMGDAAATAEMQADPRLWVGVPETFRTTTTVRQEDEFRQFLDHWRAHGFGYWLVWEAGTGPGGHGATPDGRSGGTEAGPPPIGPIGLGGLRWLWWRERWVLNTYVRLAVAVQGRGLASSLLRRAIDRLAGDLADTTTVVVRTRPENAAMARLAHHLGFHEAGTEVRSAGPYRILATRIGGGGPSGGDEATRPIDG